eukprot:s418_g17.t1
MVVEPPREVVRQSLRTQSLLQWAERRVHGKVASLQQEVFGASLFPGWYTQCLPPISWRVWCLPTDHGALGLSKVLYRCVRAIGGGWTEQLHVDSDLGSLAERWQSSQNLPSIRTCPLCKTGPGTPRHVVMSCPAMRPLVDMLRDCLELELASLVGREVLLTNAAAWLNSYLQRGELHLLRGVKPGNSRRWPLLSAWRFLVPILQRESFLSSDVENSSRAAVTAELPFELGYRAVMSLELGTGLRAVRLESHWLGQSDQLSISFPHTLGLEGTYK